MTWFPGAPPVPAVAGAFPGCSADSLGQAAEGVDWSYQVTDKGAAGDFATVVPGSARWTCVWPPAYRDVVTVCPTQLNVTIRRTTPDPTTLLDVTVPTAWASTHNPADCDGSWRLHKALDVTTWGRYAADAVATVQAATLRVWTEPEPRTHVVPAPRYVGGFSSPYEINPAQAKGQLTCRGWANDWTTPMPSWTANDCPGGSPGGLITCKTSGPPSLVNPADGVPAAKPSKTSATDVFADGTAWAITWPTPRITGATHVYSQSTTLVRQQGGTPWRTDSTGQDLPTGSTQPVVAPFDQPRSGLVAGPWSEAYLAASEDGKPTVSSLRYVEDANWSATVVTGLTINFASGSMSASTKSGTVRATGSCDSDPLAITALRARTSN